MRVFATLVSLAIATMGACAAGDPDAKIAEAQKALEPRPLTFHGQATVAEFLTQLEKQTGNHVIDRRRAPRKESLQVDFDNLAFWPALDRFCSLAGCGYTAYGEGGVALIDTPRRSSQVSYHGITRTAVKGLGVSVELDNGAPLCTIRLDLAWEPRFQPFYVGLGPATATYVPRGVAKELRVQTPARGQAPVAGRTAVELELQLPAPPRQSPAIASLEGTFKFLGPSKMLDFRFPAIKAAAALNEESVYVRLNQVKEGLDRWLIEVQIDNPEGTPTFESYQTWLDNNRIALVRGEGAKQQTWLPEPNETVLQETNRRAIIQYAFALPKEKRKIGDWTLTYRTPGRIVELTAPYSFKNVPLP